MRRNLKTIFFAAGNSIRTLVVAVFIKWQTCRSMLENQDNLPLVWHFLFSRWVHNPSDILLGWRKIQPYQISPWTHAHRWLLQHEDPTRRYHLNCWEKEPAFWGNFKFVLSRRLGISRLKTDVNCLRILTAVKEEKVEDKRAGLYIIRRHLTPVNKTEDKRSKIDINTGHSYGPTRRKDYCRTLQLC